MDNRKRLLALGAGLLLGIVGVTNAAAPAQSDTNAELAALKARVAELEGKQNQSWLNERRAEEVKALVREVLADADTRASLLEGSMTAGHNGKNFFLASEDGSFLLKIDGQIQLRYTYNSRDGQRDAAEEDDDDSSEYGMEVRRAKLRFSGHIADPRIHYNIQLAVNYTNNDVSADTITVGYDLTDDLHIWGGEDRAPFLREEMTDSRYQLAVERSLVNEIFTAGYVQGVGLIWKIGDNFKLQGVINDGARSGENGTNVLTQSDYLEDVADDDADPIDKAFDNDRSDFAVTGRVDWMVIGSNWDVMNDFSSWEGEEMSWFVGGAIHWETGETGDAYPNNNFYAYTLDSSLEMGGLSIYGAFVGFSTDYESDLGIDDREAYGALAQAAYNIPMGNNSLEPFVRIEWFDLDKDNDATSDEDSNTIWTFGVNYYLNKHNAKFQVDVVWLTEPYYDSNGDASGLGILHDAEVDGKGEDDQIVIRGQFQMLF